MANCSRTIFELVVLSKIDHFVVSPNLIIQYYSLIENNDKSSRFTSLTEGKNFSSTLPPETKVGKIGFSTFKVLRGPQRLKIPLLKPIYSILEIVGTLNSVKN